MPGPRAHLACGPGCARRAPGNTRVGFRLEADSASLLLLTPYALLGRLAGPFAGRLASALGYTTILRTGLLASAGGIVVMAMFGTDSLPILIAGTVFLGLTYAARD
ncbi:MFS transporter [Streptomyces boluensis]|uniref:MFS transporter n=1 Tax=Streptomyces boluensis TaxID=1775135 RepID=A0A964URH7_9ACTN|nr:MFS transporter [Streptomyces boluensis]NBE50400.1 hypothetical protein [Streptomyces boluensis]